MKYQIDQSGKIEQIVSIIDLALMEKCEENYKEKQYQEKQVTNQKWGKNMYVHDFPAFAVSIYATIRNVNEMRIPMRKSKKEGLCAEGRILGRKYPRTLYNPTAFDKSSAYLESNLYCSLAYQIATWEKYITKKTGYSGINRTEGNLTQD